MIAESEAQNGEEYYENIRTEQDNPSGLSRQSGRHDLSGRMQLPLSFLPEQRACAASLTAAGDRCGRGIVLSQKKTGDSGRSVYHRRGAHSFCRSGRSNQRYPRSGLSGEAGHQRHTSGGSHFSCGKRTDPESRRGHQGLSGELRRALRAVPAGSGPCNGNCGLSPARFPGL